MTNQFTSPFESPLIYTARQIELFEPSARPANQSRNEPERFQMAKDKSKSGTKNKHLHARVAFLHKAATYLTEQSGSRSKSPEAALEVHSTTKSSTGAAVDPNEPDRVTTSAPSAAKEQPISIQKPSLGGLPIYLSSHLSQAARKSQIRLAPEIKHSICKRCGTIQVEGETCKKFTENLSKGGMKRHADILVQECGVCGAKKRWPVGARRQRKKNQRSVVANDKKGQIKGSDGAVGLGTDDG